MKRKFIAVAAATLFGLTTFIACNKKDNTTTQAKQAKMDATAQCQQADFTTFDFGAAHNSDVQALYQGVDFSNPTTAKQQIIDNFNNIEVDASQLGMSNEDYHTKVIAMVNNLAAIHYDLRNTTDVAVRGSKYFPYIVRILNEASNITDLQKFNTNILAIETDATNNLSCLDLDVVLGTAKVAISSAALWAPTSLGGQAYGDGKVWLSLDSGWRGALIGDCSGSAGYFTSIGIGGALGWGIPGANVALLGGWALAAAIGSGCGALGI
jgi:hypothetical protein